MQRDAIDRLGLATLLLEPEMLEAVEADVHLVGTLLSLDKAMPDTTKETARAVVRKVVEDLEKRLVTRTRATLSGALDRSARTGRPRPHDIDWNRTIGANLKHYLPEHRTVVPERLVGYGRASRSVKKEIVLCVDQSGSMAASLVYASVFGAVLASMRSIDTRLVVFDTAVVDLTDQLDDPVDVLFGTRLGGGTDINRALAYCQSRITRPADTVVVLISDLYEGGIRDEMLKRVAAMQAAGVRFVTLLALSDEGAPAYDREHAAALAALGAPAFACTPDLFPEVMAAAIEGGPCRYRMPGDDLSIRGDPIPAYKTDMTGRRGDGACVTSGSPCEYRAACRCVVRRAARSAAREEASPLALVSSPARCRPARPAHGGRPACAACGAAGGRAVPPRAALHRAGTGGRRSDGSLAGHGRSSPRHHRAGAGPAGRRFRPGGRGRLGGTPRRGASGPAPRVRESRPGRAGPGGPTGRCRGGDGDRGGRGRRGGPAD